jgi:hypothetical protein
MKKIIRLTESDLAKIIKKVISETQENVQNFVGIKMKKIVVDKNSDGTLGDKTMITLSNGDTVTKDMINNISDECGSGGDVNSLNEKCMAQFSTNKLDLTCFKSGCSKMM